MPNPTPEEIQMMMGIHPDQVAAQNAFINAAQGDSSGFVGNDENPLAGKNGRINTGGQPPAPSPLPVGAKAYNDDGTPAEMSVTGTAANGRPNIGIVPPHSRPAPIKVEPTSSEGAPSTPAPSGPFPGADISSPTPAAAKPSDSNILTDPIKVQIGADQQREAKDRAEAERIRSTGSGVDQFSQRHHIIGPILKGLSIAGTALAPGLSAAIPGTDMHHNVLQNQADNRVEGDVSDQTKHFNMFDRIEANRMRDEANQSRESQANAKFTAGTEKEDPNSPTGWTAQTVGGEWKPYTPPSNFKQTKGESFAEIQRQRTIEADNQHLTGEKRELYIANGKLPDPGVHVHVPSAASEELEMWKNAFKTEHGRDPNSAEIMEYKRGGAGSKGNQKTFKDTAAIDKYSNDWYNKQRKEVLDEKNKVKSLNPDAAGDDTQLQAEYKRIEGEYNQRVNNFENQKKQWYDQLKGGKPVTVNDEGEVPAQETGNDSDIPQPIASVRTGAQPTPASQPQGQDVGGGFKRGQQVMVDNKPMYITGFNAQTGKPKVSPTPPAQ